MQNIWVSLSRVQKFLFANFYWNCSPFYCSLCISLAPQAISHSHHLVSFGATNYRPAYHTALLPYKLCFNCGCLRIKGCPLKMQTFNESRRKSRSGTFPLFARGRSFWGAICLSIFAFCNGFKNCWLSFLP